MVPFIILNLGGLIGFLIIVLVIRWVFVSPINKRLDRQLAVLNHLDSMIGNIQVTDPNPPPVIPPPLPTSITMGEMSPQ